jgi:DNA gyrase subunit A
MAVGNISTMGRNTQGVKLINLDEGDGVASVAPIATASDVESDDSDSNES